MKNISVVIGTNYGDEGKGLVTDFLAHTSGKDTAVVRYNGGSQAGHTVVLPNSHFRHVFHSLGSGTLAGCPTILAREFIVNPLAIWSEIFELITNLKKAKHDDKLPALYIDSRCKVTTPYEMEINRLLERSRGDDAHGSCGAGVGETVERHERGFPFTLEDVVNGETEEKLLQIKNEYYPARLEELGLEPVDIEDDVLEQFCKDARDLVRMADIVSDIDAIHSFSNIIFEGAQGLCLDQDSQDFPNVTRSKTGLAYVKDILDDLKDHVIHFDSIYDSIDVHYISRIYNTRHGNGPLAHEIKEFATQTSVKDRTNVTNEFQGHLRYATLDLVRLHTDVYNDLEYLENFNYVTTACVTHCDQIGQVFPESTVKDVTDMIMGAMDTSQLLVSFGRHRTSVFKIDNLELD